MALFGLMPVGVQTKWRLFRKCHIWNLLIDVLARSGDYKPNAPRLQHDFVGEGEQRYWVIVAIDRVTVTNMTANNALVLISTDQEPTSVRTICSATHFTEQVEMLTAHHSLKSPACSWVSITLPSESQTRITASCERL